MAKKALVIFLLLIMMLVLSGCENSADILTTKSEDNTKAYIKVNNTTIVVDVYSYLFGSNGIAIVTGTDGTNYKTHSVNVVLVKGGE